jgi:hypothetical protein
MQLRRHHSDRSDPKRVAALWMSSVLLGSCGSGAAATNAVLNTTLAATTAVVERSQGRCYAACPTGTACNTSTGYCDPIPCGGSCRADEKCQETPTGQRCIGQVEPDLLPEQK